MLIFWKAFDYTLQGAINTFYNEIAFSIELAFTVILIPVELLFPVSLNVSIFLIGPVILVLIIEFLNNAFEATLNRITTEQHTLSAKAKDEVIATVLVASKNLKVVRKIVLFYLIFNFS